MLSCRFCWQHWIFLCDRRSLRKYQSVVLMNILTKVLTKDGGAAEQFMACCCVELLHRTAAQDIDDPEYQA